MAHIRRLGLTLSYREEDQLFNPYVDQFINSRTEGTIQIAVTAL